MHYSRDWFSKFVCYSVLSILLLSMNGCAKSIRKSIVQKIKQPCLSGQSATEYGIISHIDCKQGEFSVTSGSGDRFGSEPITAPKDSIAYALVNFGNIDQKCKYLPDIIDAAYTGLAKDGYVEINTICPRPIYIQLLYENEGKLYVYTNDNNTIANTNVINLEGN